MPPLRFFGIGDRSRTGEVFDLQPRHQSEVAGVGGQNRGVMDKHNSGDTCISAADLSYQLRRKLLKLRRRGGVER